MRVLIAVLFALSACGGGGSDTAEVAFEALKTAAGNRDWGAMYDLIRPSERRQGEDNLRRQREILKNDEETLQKIAKNYGVDRDTFLKMSFRDVFIHRMKSENSAETVRMFAESKIIGRHVKGDRCMLRIQFGDRKQELHFIRENGKWYWSGIGK